MIRRNKGITLIEILMVTSVAMIVGIILLAVLVAQMGVYNQQKALISQGLDLNDSLRLISDDIRISTQIADGYPTAAPLYQSSGSTLVLKLNAIDASGNVIDQVYDYIVITTGSQPNILRRKVFPDPLSSRKILNQPLTTILGSIGFTYLNNNNQIVSPSSATKVSITLSLTGKPGIGGASKSASTTTGLRNSL